RRARRACHHGACRRLSLVEFRRAAQSIAGHRRDFGNDPLHYPRRHDLLANFELFGIDRRHRLKHSRWRAHPVCDPRRNDAAVDLSRHFCRPGQHDAHHLARVHADRSAPRHRPHLVRRALPDLHAARPAAAAARTSADDDEGGRAQGSHDGPHFSRGRALCGDEPRAAHHHHHGSGDRDLAAERAGLTSPSGAAGRRYGSTAVPSISRRASGSTRRLTSTTAMAGKCRPMTSRYAAPSAGRSARYSSMSRTYQVRRTMCRGEAPACASTAAMFSSACFICATKPAAQRPSSFSPIMPPTNAISPRARMPLAKPFGCGQPGGWRTVWGAGISDTLGSPCSSLPGLTRQSIACAKSLAKEMDHPNSGVPEFGRFEYASRINPTCVVKPAGDGTMCAAENRRHDASLCEAASAAMRRSSKRCSLPVCVRGNWVTYSMVRGYLYGAMVALTWSCSILVAAASPL